MAEKILSRTQNDANGVICVSRSIVRRGDKDNVLAVQLHNGSDYIIDGISLRVEYLDREGGTVHEAKEFTVNGLMGLPGMDFTLPDISVPASREAANVKIYAVTSGDYYYRISDDGKSIESEVHSRDNSVSAAAETKIKGGAKRKIYILYAAFVAALLVLAFAAGFFGLLNGGGSAESGAEDIEEDIEIVREIGEQDVETRETY